MLFVALKNTAECTIDLAMECLEKKTALKNAHESFHKLHTHLMNFPVIWCSLLLNATVIS